MKIKQILKAKSIEESMSIEDKKLCRENSLITRGVVYTDGYSEWGEFGDVMADHPIVVYVGEDIEE